MNPSGLHLVTTWGLTVLGLGVLLTAALMWCHEVNQKLNYLMGQMNKGGKGSESIDWVAMAGVSKNGEAVPLHVAFAIIASAIILLFVIPFFLLNR